MSPASRPAHQSPDTRALNLLRAIVEREFARQSSAEGEAAIAPACPRCGGSDVHRRGHDSTGKQRFQCRDCNRSFTLATGSAFSSSNIPKETWLKFAECHVRGESLRVSAEYCQVSLKTAYYMRRRMGNVVAEYSQRLKQKLTEELKSR